MIFVNGLSIEMFSFSALPAAPFRPTLFHPAKFMRAISGGNAAVHEKVVRATRRSVRLLFKQIDTAFLCCLVFLVPVLCLPLVRNILRKIVLRLHLVHCLRFAIV